MPWNMGIEYMYCNISLVKFIKFIFQTVCDCSLNRLMLCDQTAGRTEHSYRSSLLVT